MKWFNIRGRSDCTFQFFIGGRGIGKTYSALLSHYEAWKQGNAGNICYMRLTAAEIEQCTVEISNPYKTINRDKHFSIKFHPAGKKQYVIKDHTGENESATNEDSATNEQSNVLGIGAALSSLGSLRGADFNDVTELYFDEFIPVESVQRTPVIKTAGKLFKNAYETINRNRELFGQDPVKCFFTANAFSLDSDILNAFSCVDIIQHMQKTGQRRYTDKARSIYIELCEAAEITQAKMQTALYKALKPDDEYIQMAIKNEFTDYVLTLLKKPPIIEYKPILAYKDITIYMHKSNGTMHAAKRRDNVPAGCAYDDATRGIFIEAFYFEYKTALQMRLITFDSPETKQSLDRALDKSIRL